MVFSSFVFLFIFLPAVLILNFLLKREFRNFFLLLASLGFYAWGEGILVVLMLFSIALNYVSGLGIFYFLKKSAFGAKMVLGVAVAINLCLLLYYKYANFIVDSLQDLGFYLEYDHQNILLPIGISFFTFQGISYLVDVYRRETDVQKNIFHLGLYISFFPQLIAGPIIRYHDIAIEINERTTNKELFAEGTVRFIRGLAKKVVIANNAALIADQAFAVAADTITTPAAWIGILCYTIQIYFDFSGYSDMAIGLGKMLGFNFKENFNYPYVAKSIQDFWRRWHISLSTWFRDYLYIPLGGNRGGSAKTYMNLILVFFVTGLWHGASWNFIFWGLFHGLFLILERSKILKTDNWPKILQHVYVIIVVVFGWIFFRAETMKEAFEFIKTLVGFSKGDSNLVFVYLNNYSVLLLVFALVFATPIRENINARLKTFNQTWLKYPIAFGTKIFYLILFLFSIMELAQSGYNPFIYFRF